jgi:hypothetical protein
MLGAEDVEFSIRWELGVAAWPEGTKKKVLPRAIAGEIVNEKTSGVRQFSFNIVAMR